MKVLTVSCCILAVLVLLPACGGDPNEDGYQPVPTDANADVQPALPQIDDPGNGPPPGRGMVRPCDRAMCNDLDQREWRARPPDDLRPEQTQPADPGPEQAVSPLDRVDRWRLNGVRLDQVRVPAARGR